MGRGGTHNLLISALAFLLPGEDTPSSFTFNLESTWGKEVTSPARLRRYNTILMIYVHLIGFIDFLFLPCLCILKFFLGSLIFASYSLLLKKWKYKSNCLDIGS